MDNKQFLTELAIALTPPYPVYSPNDGMFMKSVHLWNIVSFLRGPDEPLNDAQMLKYLTTARVRSIIGMTKMVNTRHYRLTPSEIDYRDTLLEKASAHFRKHYFDAVETIKVIYHYDLKTESDI